MIKTERRIQSGLFLVFLLMGFFPMNLAADVPMLINYQGYLTDNTGTPLSGSHLVNFNLYHVETAGTHFWTEPQSVEVTDGIFNVTLGETSPLSGSDFVMRDLFLEVEIHVSGLDWDTLIPRQQLTSTPFSIRAGDAVMLEGHTLSDLNADYVNLGEPNAVTSYMIADNTLSAFDLGNDSVGADEIATGAVETKELADNAVTAPKIADNAVGTSEVMDHSLTASDLSDDYVDTTGDTMSGNLNVNAHLIAVRTSTGIDDYTAAFESSGGDHAYAISGVASAVNEDARGVNLDIESEYAIGTGIEIEVDASEWATGIKIDTNSYTNQACGVRIFSLGRGDLNSTYGIDSSSNCYDTGSLFGLKTSSNHYGDSGLCYGLYAEANGSDDGDTTGVYSKAYKIDTGNSGTAIGGHFVGENNRGGVDEESYGVLGEATGINGSRYGLYGRATTSGDLQWNYAVYAESSSTDYTSYGYYADVDLTTADSNAGYGGYFHVSADADSPGTLYGSRVLVNHLGTEGSSYGFYARVYPSDTGRVYGLYSQVDYGSTTGDAFAGKFVGDVDVNGTLSKGGGAFKIDHPLDPENKYLQHSFMESPDMMNVYNGNVILNETGEAWVNLPEYFEALNRDFRYQLTCIGGFAQVYIAEEISENRFKIDGGNPGMKVSWLVTGIRKDAWAEANRIEVEVDKDQTDRGSYLYPEVYGEDITRSVEFARHPELARRDQ